MGVEGLLNPVEEKQNTHDYKSSLTFSRKKCSTHVDSTSESSKQPFLF